LFRLSACKDAGFYITGQIKKDIIKHIFKIIETYLQLLLFFNIFSRRLNIGLPAQMHTYFIE